MSNGQLYKLRRSMGLCTACGAPLEREDGKYSYACPECRAKRKAYQKKFRESCRELEQQNAEAIARSASNKARGRTRKFQAPERCLKCVWANYAGGGVWYCPLVGCAKASAFETLENAESNA